MVKSEGENAILLKPEPHWTHSHSNHSCGRSCLPQGEIRCDVTPEIHHALREKRSLSVEHMADTNDAEAKPFVQSHQEYGN